MLGLLVFAQNIWAQDTTVYQLSPTQIIDSLLRPFQNGADQTTFTQEFGGNFAVSGLSADAVLRQSEGLYVRDYGGHGGLKTVSIRGFSAQQTTVTLNDIPYNSVQSSVVNFGFF